MRVLASVLIAIGCVSAVPATAIAAEYTVDSTADEADVLVNGVACLTAGGKCTLRAAIEESNFSTAVDDTIKFAAAFNGEAADTIAPGSALPAITDKVHIDGDSGGQCATGAGVSGPCAGVNGPGAGSALVVENADEVEIEGLAITGAITGINVINSSEEFKARDDWLGVKLDGSAGGNTTGIFLDPNSNQAGIGGIEAGQRNVFANNAGDGLDLLGTIAAEVEGNYFGVKPDGSTKAANGKDIEVNSTSVGGFEALGNLIGRQLSPEAAATPACDGGCNVISGASAAAVDLQGDGGQEAAAGRTIIEGNHIGLNAAGAGAVANSNQGVLVGSAKEVVVAANHINGGTYGVFAGAGGKGADDLLVEENLIGLNPAGTETLSPPGSDAIFVSSEGISSFAHAAEISDNRISMLGGIGIEQHSIGALISGNDIGRGVNGENLSGAATGIKLWGESVFGNTVESNVVENSAGNGILIENDNNQLVGNVVEGAGEAGIRIQDFLTLASTGNLIGGDTAQEENAISDSGGDAIEVAGEEDDDTQIARNFGDSNGGLFIDLGADGESNNALTGPNAGIQAPTISAAKLTGASGGGALPGATIRVFRKATASPGEIKSFLGKATANGSGNWSLTYAASIPGSTPIAATQSDIEGTSELALATTEPAPAEKGGGGGKGDGGKKGSKDTTPPQTTILKGPKAKTHSTTAKFTFSSSEAGSKFECKLDRKRFKRCRSPKTYKGLKPGKHVFRVRAIDKAHNVDPTPAKKKFRVLG